MSQPNQTKTPMSLKAKLAILLFAGYAIAAMILYLPPYSWLADLQLRLLGQYHQKFTIFLAMLAMMAPYLAYLGLRKVWLRWTFPDHVIAPSAVPAGATNVSQPDAMTTQDITQWTGVILVILAGLVFCGYGLYKVAHASGVTQMATYTAADIYQGKTPASEYVTVAGEVTTGGITWESGHSGEKDYIPLVPEGLQPDQVTVILEISKYDRKKVQSQRQFCGMLSKNGLSGDIAGSLNRAGVTLSDPYYVLELNQTPQSAAGNGWILFYIGGTMTVGFVLLYLWRSWRVSRARSR